VWIWTYETEDGNCHDLYMDVKKEIRFQVVEEMFVDVSPSAPEASEAAEKEKREREARQSPYTIIVGQVCIYCAVFVTHNGFLNQGSASRPGLGLLEWWQS
jgi:DNA-directed RNA polymerase subunit E'/Rpb7